MLAVGNVIFKIIPYFIIANVITMFLDGSNEFKEYLIKAIGIALSFIIAELFHSFLSLSHKATFTVRQYTENPAVKSWRGCRLDMKDTIRYIQNISGGKKELTVLRQHLVHIVPEFTLQSASTGHYPNLFLHDRLEDGIMVLSAGGSWISFLFWHDD